MKIRYINIINSVTAFFVVAFICTSAEVYALHNPGMRNCGICHQIPDRSRISGGPGFPLNIFQLEKLPAANVKDLLIDFLKNHNTIKKALTKDTACRGVADYLGLRADQSNPCSSSNLSDNPDVKFSLDSFDEENKEFIFTITGISKKLIQKDQSVVDQIKVLIALEYSPHFVANIRVEIYEPTYFRASSPDDRLVDPRIIPKEYAAELTVTQKAIAGKIGEIVLVKSSSEAAEK